MIISLKFIKILGADWLKFHPYDSIDATDTYYINLSTRILQMFNRSSLTSDFFEGQNDAKNFACYLAAYFEDVISETRMFATFRKIHEKLYGKHLPFYDLTEEDYYEDEVNLRDIHFLFWYYFSVKFIESEQLTDPFWENIPEINLIIDRIYNLFESEFENAPINKKLHDFIFQFDDNEVLTVRKKLEYVAQKSYLHSVYFSKRFAEMCEKYMQNGRLVLTEEGNIHLYDQRINYIFNDCLPLFAILANEYYAELLAEEHPYYQLIKHISKRKFGYFLPINKESDRLIIKHIPSNKEIVLSKEMVTFPDYMLHENETILCIGIVEWSDNVWQMMGSGFLLDEEQIVHNPELDSIFADDLKRETIENQKEAFLQATGGKYIKYVKGKEEYCQFITETTRIYTKIVNPQTTDKEIDELMQPFIENQNKMEIPFAQDEPITIFFNEKSGMETYYDNVTRCLSDKYNPYYVNGETFDWETLITIGTFSKEFIHYILENKIINLTLDEEIHSYTMYDTINENLDFLLRFYRRNLYWSEPEVSIQY